MDNGVTRLDLHASAAYGLGVYALALVLALVPIGAVAFAAVYVVSRVRGAIAARRAAARILASHHCQYAQVERTLARANSVLANSAPYASAPYASAPAPAASTAPRSAKRAPRSAKRAPRTGAARLHRGAPAARLPHIRP